MEAIARDYSPKGVQFYYIYKALAHPESEQYIQPETIDERLMHVHEAENRIGGSIPWLCDTMTNDVMHALGNAPTSEFIISPAGRIVRKRTWGDPQQLRKDLEELVGPVENPTDPHSLNLIIFPRLKSAPDGVVKRIKVPQAMIPLVSKPTIKPGDPPLYAKLRADTDQSLFESGTGKLYVGFHLDPIYQVHWNNLTKPIHIEFDLPPGVRMPDTLDGPQVSAEADIDPREFLIDVQGWTTEKPIRLTVDYFGCSDHPAFCIPITQHYTIYRQLNRRAGWIRGRIEPTGPFQTAKPKSITGVVQSMDRADGTFIVKTPQEEIIEFQTSEYTELFLNSISRPLSDLKPGLSVQIDFFHRSAGPFARDIRVRD